jgi:hypothetical protein
MGELTTDSTPGWWTPAAAPTAESIAHDPRHYAIGCPECFDELQRNRDWWKARLEGRYLSGSSSRVTTYPSVVEQRNDLARFGVGILDFEHPAPGGSATWEQRFGRSTETLQAGDVLVVVSEGTLGQTSDEVRTIRTLRRHTSWSRC